MNEVARRAGIHPTTFFSEAQRELGREVKAWVDSLKMGQVVGRMRVRRELAKRVEDWRTLYDSLADSHHKTELDLQQAQAERDHAVSEAEALRQENEQLKRLLDAATGNKVTALVPKKVLSQ
jgi:cell shape-determining protein MreC